MKKQKQIKDTISHRRFMQDRNNDRNVAIFAVNYHIFILQGPDWL